MTSSSPAARPKRIRRRPEVAEREILDAAEAFLQEHDFRDLTVEAVMRSTGISRSTFYNYFADRNALVLGLLRRVEDEMMEASRPWLERTGDPRAALRAGLEGTVESYARHARVLRGVLEASYHDGDVERAFRQGFLQNFIDAVADRLRREGTTPDPDAIAHALLMVNTEVTSQRLGGPDPDPLEDVARTLVYVWERVVYGDVS